MRTHTCMLSRACARSRAYSAGHSLCACATAGTPGCKPGSSTDVEPCCLVRAVGPGLKFSAMVSSRSYQRFMQSYGNILKVSLDSLKKREKKKAEKKAGSSKAT